MDYPNRVATTLPAPAALALKRAANTPIPSDDPLARTRAVEKAIRWVRYQYPQFFQQE